MPADPSAALTRRAAWQQGLLYIAILFFAVQVLPLTPAFWRALVALDGQYPSLFVLASYTPDWVGRPGSFGNMAVAAGLALVGALIWMRWTAHRTAAGHPPPNHNRLQAWLRLALRYRLAVGLLAFGLIKLIPLQAPAPSLSALNTPYGEMTEWKLFVLTLGIVPSYQSFLGAIETLAGLLLLTRRSATIGAFITVFFSGNVFMSNLAYGGGDGAYALLLFLMALYLLCDDIPRLYRLLVLGRPTAPNRYRLRYGPGWPQTGRWVAKAALAAGLLLYAGTAFRAWQRGGHQYPADTRPAVLGGAAGLYTVRTFQLNGQTRPPSATDSVRWDNVVVERWNTLSIRRPAPAPLDPANRETIAPTDAARTFEAAGQIGRHYYRYQPVMAASHTLQLQNSQRPADTYRLTYTQPRPGTLVLAGRNARHDSVYAVLERVDKPYLLVEAARSGRRHQLRL